MEFRFNFEKYLVHNNFSLLYSWHDKWQQKIPATLTEVHLTPGFKPLLFKSTMAAFNPLEFHWTLKRSAPSLF